MKIFDFFVPPCAFDAKWTLHIANSKFAQHRWVSIKPAFGGRNPKWFDRLTILSEVEGQIRMTKMQNSKQGSADATEVIKTIEEATAIIY